MKRLDVMEVRPLGPENGWKGQTGWRVHDAIREALVAKGVVLEDSPEGTRWKIAK